MTTMVQTEREYGEALFSLALEESCVKEYLEALSSVRQVLCDNPDYIEFLASPAIPMSERRIAIEQAFCGMPEYVVSFIQLLCESSKIRYIFGCIEEFDRLATSALGRTAAEIYSAVALSDDQKKKVCERIERLTDKSVDPIYIIDESLIGGIKIEVDGMTLDGSLKHRLSEIKDVMNS